MNTLGLRNAQCAKKNVLGKVIGIIQTFKPILSQNTQKHAQIGSQNGKIAAKGTLISVNFRPN